MLVDEYNTFYRENPNRWESASHDRYIFEAVAPYGQAVNLLDVGCGNGHTLHYFKSRWPHTDCHGVDLSSEAIRIARKRNPNINFKCADWEHENYIGFDTILLAGVAEHFQDPDRGLKRLHDALTFDGIAYLEVPNCIGYPTAEKGEGYRRINQGSRQMEWHLYRKTWEKKILDAGLRIVKAITGPTIYMEFIWLLERNE